MNAHSVWRALGGSVKGGSSAARLRRVPRPGPRDPLLRQLVFLFWRDVKDPAKNALVRLPAAAPGSSQVVLGHESRQLLAHRGADELVHGHALPLISAAVGEK